MPRVPLLLLALALAAGGALALDNGVARTPPMGWLSWERFAGETDCARYPDTCISEALYLRQARALVEGGYAAAGYRYVNIDDAWPAMNRTADGQLQADPQRFPHGIAWLADQVHAMGLLLGIYLDVGPRTCLGYPGFDVPTGPGPLPADPQYVRDVQLLASWGIDSLKVDGCNADARTMNVSYPRLGEALEATGRKILYSCSWPDYVRLEGLPVQYGLLGKYCNDWRLYDDVRDSYASVSGIAQYWANQSVALGAAAGPGGWNDPDMLVIGGTGLSHAQEQIQMALWSVWAAPLLMSNDLTAISNSSAAVLLNRRAVAVNQDPLGLAPRLVSRPDGGKAAVWARTLSGGSVAVVLVNFDSFGPARAVSAAAADLGLAPSASYAATDVFSGEALPGLGPGGSLGFDLLSSSCRFVVLKPSV